MRNKKIVSILLAMLLSLATLFGCSEDKPKAPTAKVEYNVRLLTRTYQLDDEESKKLKLVFTADDVEVEDWSLLKFESEDPSIATVDESGVVTGVGNGTTNVTVSLGDLKQTAYVTVTVQPRKVVLSKKSLGLTEGQSATITATAYKGANAVKNAEIVWSSSDPETVSVENGTVRALRLGTATITATFGAITESASVAVVKEATAAQVNSFDEQYVNIFGRYYIQNNTLNLDHAANAIEVGIIGTSLTANIVSSATSYMRVWIDDVELNDRLTLNPATQKYVIANGLDDTYHKIRMVKATEMQDASWDITSFEADNFAVVPEKQSLKIEFVGDSLTAGYGSLGAEGSRRTVENSDPTRTYAYYTSHQLNADYSVVAMSGICAKAYHWSPTLNMYTLYQQTSSVNTSAYGFDFAPDIVVLNLGTNEADYIAKNPTYATQFPTDYKDMLTLIRSKNPNAYIICLFGFSSNDSAVNSGINTAIEQMNDDKIIYNPFALTPNTSGASGHPSATAQAGWAEQLVNYINTMNIN